MSRRREISAGLLAYRQSGPEPEYLLAHPGGPYWAKKDAGSWTIPKGLVEDDNLLACARREFSEETGLTANGEMVPLAPVKQKSGKTVHAFAVAADLDIAKFKSLAFELEWPPHSGKRTKFPEIDRIGYFPFAAAMEKIIDYQKPFLVELHRRLTD